MRFLGFLIRNTHRQKHTSLETNIENKHQEKTIITEKQISRDTILGKTDIAKNNIKKSSSETNLWENKH